VLQQLQDECADGLPSCLLRICICLLLQDLHVSSPQNIGCQHKRRGTCYQVHVSQEVKAHGWVSQLSNTAAVAT
jgi:hypothetical protein